ncbi:MAG: hypothetical protein IKZ64_00110 [Alphaproteobacteria bacterium]|nr:hypothetical protein [Alphaproteobacteria bacterium]
MKKIALTSLLAVFAAAGANAANVIDGNPLYMPKKGHFYSETALSSHSENTNMFTLGEEFGYGVTDQLAVSVRTAVAEDEEFDAMGWGDLTLDAKYRVLNRGAWKLDLVGNYSVTPVWGDHRPFLEEDDTLYAWTMGVRGGYATPKWTVAGHLMFVYGNTETFNWGDEGAHMWKLGVDGQYVIDNDWNVAAGVEYTGVTDDGAKNAGTFDTYVGVNYNIDATKYVGAYISHNAWHHGGDKADEWEFTDGFGYGVKFGIDF